ncbi:unnamed protein product [Cylindrotheca closterium]|uniref:Uncharacterized protein n=1 Tax=Cylindrotheca closterium TaxID=2856 RepID=A0AAD2PWR3_9STRA|nr:unnamed protein product [Cylindrotheca closterium]
MTTSKSERILRFLFSFLSITSILAFHLPQQQNFHRSIHWQLHSSGKESKSKYVPDDTENGPINSKSLLEDADDSLRLQRFADQQQQEDDSAAMNRRLFMGAALLGSSAVVSNLPQDFASALAEEEFDKDGFGKLNWISTPVNKRTGVTVFDAEKLGYNVRFVTYLSRFLLVFDLDCQKWWYSKAAEIPRAASKDEVELVRLKQFGAFSASVEIGLQEYGGSDGPAKLMKSLVSRYCPDLAAVRKSREQLGLTKLTEDQELKEMREIKEARRQIALLFGLMEKNQPTEEINQLLAAIDNGSIKSVVVEDGGSGYAPGYGSPYVEFPPPKAGPDFKTATGRATLRPNGKILRLDVGNRGNGYQKPPTVTLSAPGATSDSDVPKGKAATAKAYIFKNGPNKGKIERFNLVDQGEGYKEGERIRVTISPPELSPENGGVTATANTVMELEVASIEVVDGGSGYAIETNIPIYVEPPPATAKVNLNDPYEARIIDRSQPLPKSLDPKLKKLILEPNDPNSLTSNVGKVAKNEGVGGAGGCIGRACYDRPVVACAKAQAETSSFSEFRNEIDAREAVDAEAKVVQKRIVNAVSAGADSQMKIPAFWNGGPSSSSAQLLTLIPAGIGLEYDQSLRRFVLSADTDFLEINKGSLVGTSNRPLDPEFGPRGRSPIERDVTLNLSSFLRFSLSGAICASGAHFLLTPLDVVKTKLQTDPENYPGVIRAFKKLAKEGGIEGFFAGWAPTFVGFFFWGSASYSTTELLRRYFVDALGPEARTLEVPIILLSSAIGAAFSTFIICPFESIRIRSVSQPDYGTNLFDVTARMVKEDGVSSLFSAVPPMLAKEIPFNTAKFLIFSLVSNVLYDAFPAAQEDIKLSLGVSLVSGMTGGLFAAIVSNPGDATISEMKKSQTKVGPIEAVKSLIDKGGYAMFFRGLPVRMAFYPLIVSMQFFAFDAIRLNLGIGSDDLKLYLDVLGGALNEGSVGPA